MFLPHDIGLGSLIELIGNSLPLQVSFQEFTMGLLGMLSDEDGVDYVTLVIIGLFVIAFVTLFLGIVQLLLGGGPGSGAKKESSIGEDGSPVIGVSGRLEKLERTLQEFKTDSSRAQEFYSIEFDWIRSELKSLRDLLETKGSSGSSSGGSGGGSGPIGGPSGGGAGSPPSDDDEWDLKSERDAAKEAPKRADGVSLHEKISRAREEARSGESSSQEESAGEGVIADEVAEALLGKKAEREERPAPLEERLQKTRKGFFSRIKEVFSGKRSLDSDMIEELEALLIGSDLGVIVTERILSQLKSDVSSGNDVSEENVRSHLEAQLAKELREFSQTGNKLSSERVGGAPRIVLIVGVNGVGKTTTTAKLAHQLKTDGARPLLVAADTFRAAAVSQLKQWGERLGVPVVSGAENAKPATVIYDALERSKKGDVDVVLIDTAGRLHNKGNLMRELEGVENSIKKHYPDAPHDTLLVVDGSTGQNAIMQAREFDKAVSLNGVIVTKLDGTAKGGIVVAISEELKIPIRYIGVGESQVDLRAFDPDKFARAIFDTEGLNQIGKDDTAPDSEQSHGARRRRRRRGGSEAGMVL